MIIAPVKGNFRISQAFGKNPQIYKRFKMKGHNGQDLALPVGTSLFSPIDGIVELRNSGDKGYGLHLRITEKGKGERRQIVLAHLSEAFVESGEELKAGQLVGLSGNSGFSSGPHLHWGLRRLNPNGTVKNYDNGFFGWENIFEQAWILENKVSKY